MAGTNFEVADLRRDLIDRMDKIIAIMEKKEPVVQSGTPMTPMQAIIALRSACIAIKNCGMECDAYDYCFRGQGFTADHPYAWADPEKEE